MPDQPSYDFVYVRTDIPEGMTIREWRAQRAMERRQGRARAHRRRARLSRVLAAVAPWRSARAIVWRSQVRHSSDAHGSIST